MDFEGIGWLRGGGSINEIQVIVKVLVDFVNGLEISLSDRGVKSF